MLRNKLQGIAVVLHPLPRDGCKHAQVQLHVQHYDSQLLIFLQFLEKIESFLSYAKHLDFLKKASVQTKLVEELICFRSNKIIQLLVFKERSLILWSFCGFFLMIFSLKLANHAPLYFKWKIIIKNNEGHKLLRKVPEVL